LAAAAEDDDCAQILAANGAYSFPSFYLLLPLGSRSGAGPEPSHRYWPAAEGPSPLFSFHNSRWKKSSSACSLQTHAAPALQKASKIGRGHVRSAAPPIFDGASTLHFFLRAYLPMGFRWRNGNPFPLIAFADDPFLTRICPNMAPLNPFCATFLLRPPLPQVQ